MGVAGIFLLLLFRFSWHKLWESILGIRFFPTTWKILQYRPHIIYTITYFLFYYSIICNMVYYEPLVLYFIQPISIKMINYTPLSIVISSTNHRIHQDEVSTYFLNQWWQEYTNDIQYSVIWFLYFSHGILTSISYNYNLLSIILTSILTIRIYFNHYHLSTSTKTWATILTMIFTINIH